MNKPNALQRLIHRIAMLRPVTDFFSTRMHRIDGVALKLTRGKWTVSSLVGWPIIQLTTTGARTGKQYTLPLIGLMDGEKIALVASSFGREHYPGWYYNLKANPRCVVQFRGNSSEYMARETEGTEYDRYWSMALDYYKGYDLYKERASHRRIPVMVLEKAG